MATTNNSTRNFIPMQQKYDRVVLLVDMDCFYCQVEEKLDPELKGKPVAVVQYNAWRGGGIIAVNYAARAKGVTRHMRGDEAKEQCPEIQLVKVPNVREKADLSKYRDAGKDVANVLQKFTTLLERASVDEAYLDITEAVNKRLSDMNAGTFTLQPQELIDTYAVGYERFGDYLKEITQHFSNPYGDDEALNRLYEPNDIPAVRQSDVRLLLGASIASEIRASVKAQTTYECSAGIAHNKIIAKLACGMNKPNKQTIMPLKQIAQLFETLPLGKIKGLGGKFGEEVCERLKIKTLGQMLKYTEAELQKKFDEKNGSWLYHVSRGIDLEAVTPRFYSKSIGCCKKFPGRNNITGLQTLKHWLNELANEIAERLEKDFMENNRKAKQMTVSYIQENENGEEISSSRSVPLNSYDQETLATRSCEVIKANTKQFFKAGSEAILNNPIKFLGISVGKFESIDSGQTKLEQMFANQANQAIRKRKIDEAENENDERNLEEAAAKPATSQAEQQQTPPQGFLTRFLQNQAKFAKIEPKASVEPSQQPPANKSPIKSFFKKVLQNQNETKRKSMENESNDVDESSATSSNNGSLNGLLADMQAATPNLNSSNSNDSHGVSPQRQQQVASAEVENSTTSAYQNQYAEYAVPELSLLNLLEFQRCELCGMKIPKEERAQQTHRDHHFAMELSQQMRTEFRTQIESQQKNKSINKGNNSKSLKSNKKSTPAAAPIMTKFLKAAANSTSTSATSTSTAAHSVTITPSDIIELSDEMEAKNSTNEQATPATTTAAASTSAAQAQIETLTCEKCKKSIPTTEWTAHFDYHVARELQIELNKEAMSSNIRPKTSPSPASAAASKAASRRAKNPTKSKSKAPKPISKFFTQTQATQEALTDKNS